MDHKTINDIEQKVPSLILRFIGRGLNHIVYDCGNNFVLKIPYSRPLVRVPDYETVQFDYAISCKYFGEYILQAKIVPGNVLPYHILQKKINGFPLSRHMIPYVLAQFTEIVRINELLLRERGLYLDLLGYDFF